MTSVQHVPLQRAGSLDLETLPDAVLLDLGERYRRAGKPEEALEFAEPLVSRSPQDREAHLLAARLHAQPPEDVAGAERHFRLADQLAPLTVDDYWTWIRVLIGAQRHTAVREVVDRLVVARPDDPDALVAAGQVHDHLGDDAAAWACAGAALDRIDGLDDATTNALLAQVFGLRMLGRRDEDRTWVAAQLHRVAAAGPLTRTRVADLFFDLDEPREVLNALSGPLTDPDRPDWRRARARAASGLGRYAEAAAIFDRSELSLGDRVSYLSALLGVGRFDDARRQWDQLSAEVVARRAEVAGNDQAGELLDALAKMEVLLHLVDVSLSDTEHDYRRRWEAARRLDRAAADYRLDRLDVELQAMVMGLRLELAVDDEQREAVLADLTRLDLEHDHQVIAEYVEAHVWAGSVAPPRAALRPGPWQESAGARLRRQGELAARAAHSRDDSGTLKSLRRRSRMAMICGDVRLAETLLPEADLKLATSPQPDPGVGPVDSSQKAAFVAQVHLLNGRCREAMDLCAEDMRHRRHDLAVRLTFAHAALACDELDVATAEAVSCARTAPENVVARVQAAECLFEQAVAQAASASASAAEQPVEAPQSQDNLHQLIQAVAEYHRAVQLHRGLARWLAGEPVERHDLGSELLPDTTLEEVCRQGLHAAILASEGLTRLQLRRDHQLDAHAGVLARQLEELQGEDDESRRLLDLVRAHRRWLGRQTLVRVGYLVAGALLVGVPLAFDGLDTQTALFSAVGVALILLAAIPVVKLPGIELAREKHELIYRRSEVLRSSPALRLERRLLNRVAALPDLTEATTHRPAPQPPARRERRREQPPPSPLAPPDSDGRRGDQLLHGDAASQGARAV